MSSPTVIVFAARQTTAPSRAAVDGLADKRTGAETGRSSAGKLPSRCYTVRHSGASSGGCGGPSNGLRKLVSEPCQAGSEAPHFAGIGP
ncbi:unnamed protein product [Peronospora belbahrii]|uniref:Uncharacterized protein n=1 Tax=Peronospora belbahrii TaxID=622444 RepID=A0ABN8DB11_9STRA|nr:unnamed protein product [Peronospora belbahrii]